MNLQKNQEDAASAMLRDLQGEVSEESAPLLQFIVRWAPAIAGIVLALLLALCTVAAWKWYRGRQDAASRAELEQALRSTSGSQRDEALGRLAEKAPASTRLGIYLALGQSASANGNPALAAQAYARAAELDDGALGAAAALNGAFSLMDQGDFAGALAILRQLEGQLPEAAQSPGFRQLLAEAALGAGQKQAALDVYRALGQGQGGDSEYFRARADALAAELGAEDAAPAPQAP